MATKPKAVLSTHDGREASPITKASNVLFENGQTAQDILNDRQDAMISPVIANSSSMFKVGQGDNVDYSSNVVNGAYESMVLKGRSLVNYIQEPSSQDVVLPYQFTDGQHVTINDTKENGALGVELKGQTLVNLLAQDSSTNMYTTRTQIDRGYRYTQQYNVSMGATRFQWDITNSGHNRLKINTKYCVQFTVKVKKRRNVRVLFEGGIEYTTTLAENSTTNIKCIVQSGEVLKRFFVYVYPPTDESYTGDTFDVLDFMTIEYQEGMENWDIPYFEGMASCKMPTLHTVGKNLFDITKLEGLHGDIEIIPNGIRVRSIQIDITRCFTNPFKENTQYTVSFTHKQIEGEGREGFRFYYTDGTNSYLIPNPNSSCVGSSLPNKTVKSISLSYNTYGISELTYIQIEESPSATTYEPYKSSILSLPEEVVLGGLGSARDTLNTVTGKYTKRTDTMTVMNYKNSLGSGLIEGAWSIVVTPPNKKWQSTMLCVSDKFSMGGGHSDRNCGFYENPANFVFFDRTVNSADEFIAKYGDFSFTYILENPIITKINLPSTLKSWNTTTHIYSEITENSLYPILSHSNPTYPVILKPSTKYSIVANSYSNSHANSAINFNLGGATASTTVGNRVTTITTPSTLSNELLTMSGRGNRLNNVMVIEGDIVGDEPYFEGICDVKSPTLSNCGKNLFDGHLEQGSINTNNGSLITTTTAIRCDDYIELVGEKTYTISKTKGTTVISVIIFGENKNFTRATWDTTFTLNANEKYIKFTDGQNDLTNQYQIEEGVNSTPYEPYKSNILSANGDKIELTEDMFEQGGVYFTKGQSFTDATNNTNTTRIRLKTLLNLKPNTMYRVDIDDAYKVGVQIYNSEGLGVSDTGWVSNTTFTTKNGENAVVQAVRKLSSTANLSVSDFKNTKPQLSEVDKTIVLRSLPNGVCDTLNVETGEYIKRIGEKILNGTELWYAYRDGYHGVGKSTFQAYCTKDLPKTTNNEPINCNRLAQGDLAYGGNVDVVKYQTNYIHNYTDGTYTVNRIFISVNKEMFGGNAQDNYGDAMIKFKSWIQSNPITVQYQLAEPIVKTVDLSGYPFSYENGHVILSSGSIEQSLTPKVEYSVATNRNGQIRSNQKMVERHQKQLDQLQAIILANLVNSQYNQTLTTLKYELSRV